MAASVRNTMRSTMAHLPSRSSTPPAPARGPAAPAAVLFDAYGTLFDVHSVALAAEQRWPGQGQALSTAWRERQISYTRLVSMSGRYQPFWDLTRAALRQGCAQLGLALDDAAEAALMNEYRHLSPFPEALGVLQALRARGVPTGILSNGDPAMLEVSVRSAGFQDLLGCVLSAHAVQRYKTDPAVYQLGCDHLRLPARRILFVSANGWDAIGATWFGYTTLWVDRQGLPLDPLDTRPTRCGHSLRDVLDAFPAPAGDAAARRTAA
jgi:2-haloacid dehalogenase